ncbi:MAG: flavin reductase family protein [Pseudomonadota bacterium]
MTVTRDDWRAAMGAFASGVTIVTSLEGDQPRGSTVSAFTSVSLDPPLLLICVDKSNPLHAPLLQAGFFGVHILGADQGDLGMRFAVPPVETRFDNLDFTCHEGGAPHIVSAPVFIDCETQQVHEAGTHHIFIGRGVRIMNGPEQPPLVYHKGGFGAFTPA